MIRSFQTGGAAQIISHREAAMKKMITICAECKKELKTSSGSAVEEIFTSLFLSEEIVYSHSICNECGIRLYGNEIMSEITGKMKRPVASCHGFIEPSI
jgi:hypothetical protein